MKVLMQQGRRQAATHDQRSQMRDSKTLLGWLALKGAPTHQLGRKGRHGAGLAVLTFSAAACSAAFLERELAVRMCSLYPP